MFYLSSAHFYKLWRVNKWKSKKKKKKLHLWSFSRASVLSPKCAFYSGLFAIIIIFENCFILVVRLTQPCSSHCVLFWKCNRKRLGVTTPPWRLGSPLALRRLPLAVIMQVEPAQCASAKGSPESRSSLQQPPAGRTPDRGWLTADNPEEINPTKSADLFIIIIITLLSAAFEIISIAADTWRPDWETGSSNVTLPVCLTVVVVCLFVCLFSSPGAVQLSPGRGRRWCVLWRAALDTFSPERRGRKVWRQEVFFFFFAFFSSSISLHRDGRGHRRRWHPGS